MRTAHGLLPVPGPAVLAVLAEAGAPVGSGDVDGEACTPTGAALLAAVVGSWGALPTMRVQATGTGAGGRDPEGRPNVLRAVLGERRGRRAGRRVGALVLEANVDDLDPRVWPAVLAALLAAGASDAWLTPILMKKGRPAHTLSALVPPECARRRAPGRVHRELDDRRARAPGRQAARCTARPAPSRSTASTSG